MPLLPSRFIYVCLHFLVLYFQVQESQQNSADFRVYVENYTRNPDDLSRKQIRIYQLYSRTTGKHVQILGKKINANGDDGGKYALLVVETETFGSHIRIKGKESGYYICMNKKGKIIGKLSSPNIQSDSTACSLDGIVLSSRGGIRSVSLWRKFWKITTRLLCQPSTKAGTWVLTGKDDPKKVPGPSRINKKSIS
ncbi:fibroblast growth factor 24 isoform X3 [Amia ocellicauda]|uniref:fibroblast growth factor 24 isoform X3 n=1 Tax=Amia ocellicauda TaxID=2972642 RepID=UPI003464A6D7